MMKLNKTSSSNIEVILSFVIFISFIFFLFLAFPIARPAESKTILNTAEHGFFNFTNVEVFYTAFALNTSSLKLKEHIDSFYIDFPLRNMMVLNESYAQVNVTSDGYFIFVKREGDFYRAYSCSEFEESGLPKDGIKLEKEEADYIAGLTDSFFSVSYSRLLLLNHTYFTNYSGVQDIFDIPRKENFGLIVKEINGGSFLEITKKYPERTSVVAREVPIQVVYSNGTFKYFLLNVQTWR